MKEIKQAQEYRKGFTIIELMISTIVFSLVLLASSAAILEVGKKYYRGITYARTQEVARSTLEEITQSLQFTSQDVKVPNYPDSTVPADGTPDSVYGPIVATDAPAGDTFFFCIGPKRFTFAVDRKLTPGSNTGKEKEHVFWVDQPTAGCADAPSQVAADLKLPQPSVNGRELLDKNMRITKLSIMPYDNGLWNISIAIAAGEDSLLSLSDDGRVVCEGSTLGTEFCASVAISGIVSKRVQ